MSANVYGVTEIVGDLRRMVWIAAIGVGIARASTTLRGLDWFEVTDVRGHINDGRVEHYQVSMKVGFGMDAHGYWRNLPGLWVIRDADKQVD